MTHSFVDPVNYTPTTGAAAKLSPIPGAPSPSPAGVDFKTVSVIGLGYIGLPTAAVLASNGLEVIGYDVQPEVVDTINKGQIHIIEPELDEIVKEMVLCGRLRAVVTPERADAYIIAVPTPFRENHAPDLTYVESAAMAIAPLLEKGSLVILESTSPVGTTQQLCCWLAKARPDLRFPHWDEPADVHVAYCPERVLPGRVMHELVHNDRVIGGVTAECSHVAAALYRRFLRAECLLTDSRTAEMAKLTENAARDVNIAFANELSSICEKLDIDVWELIELANHHPRVKILQPGPGVGGHCIAVDPWFIVDAAPEESRMIKLAREINNLRPHDVVRRVKERARRFAHPVIACLGLSYKPDIDDLRESPAVEVVQMLSAERLGLVCVVEPHIRELPPSMRNLPETELLDLDSALEMADIVVLLVGHRQFKRVARRGLMEKVVIDTRGLWR